MYISQYVLYTVIYFALFYQTAIQYKLMSEIPSGNRESTVSRKQTLTRQYYSCQSTVSGIQNIKQIQC